MPPKKQKVIGPSGRPIIVGGATWEKLTKAQQKLASEGGFESKAATSTKKVAAKKPVVKKEATVKKAPAAKKPAVKKETVKKAPAKKPAVKKPLPKTPEKKKKALPAPPVPRREPCNTPLGCSAEFKNSMFNPTKYWLLTGYLSDCSSIEVDSFEARDHEEVLDRVARLTGADLPKAVSPKERADAVLMLMFGTQLEGLDVMLVFSNPSTDEVMKLLGREGKEARSEPVPKVLSPTKVKTPSPAKGGGGFWGGLGAFLRGPQLTEEELEERPFI